MFADTQSGVTIHAPAHHDRHPHHGDGPMQMVVFGLAYLAVIAAVIWIVI